MDNFGYACYRGTVPWCTVPSVFTIFIFFRFSGLNVSDPKAHFSSRLFQALPKYYTCFSIFNIWHTFFKIYVDFLHFYYIYVFACSNEPLEVSLKKIKLFTLSNLPIKSEMSHRRSALFVTISPARSEIVSQNFATWLLSVKIFNLLNDLQFQKILWSEKLFILYILTNISSFEICLYHTIKS